MIYITCYNILHLFNFHLTILKPTNILVQTAIFKRRISEINNYSYKYQFFNERSIGYLNDKSLFCDGVHKIKWRKSDKFSKDREMKKYYNIFDDINYQIDYQSMDSYNVYEKCCTK